LRDRFPQVPITVTYVPAASSVYRFARESVVVKEVFAPSDPAGSTYKFGLQVPPAAIRAKSQVACLKIRAATPQDVAFIDARPAFRKAATTAFVHGPRDWNHPNELGYRTLGALVAGKSDWRGHELCDAGADE
jgi:hypothetical protein